MFVIVKNTHNLYVYTRCNAKNFLNVPRGIAHKSYVYKSCDRYTLNVLVVVVFVPSHWGALYDVLANVFVYEMGGGGYLLFAIFILIQTLLSTINVQNMFAGKMIELH